MARTATRTVKNQFEADLWYSFDPIVTIGTFKVTGAGTGTWTPVVGVDLSAGYDIYARVEGNGLQGSVMEVTITGEDDTLYPYEITGEADLLERDQAGRGEVFTPSIVGRKFTTISGVTITGGTSGDEIQIVHLPSVWTLLGFDTGFTYDPGTTSRAIPNKYESADHYKRIRGEHTFTLNQLYQSLDRSLKFLQDRTITLKIGINEDGGSVYNEIHYLDVARVTTAPVDFGADGSDGSISASGLYNRELIVG